MKAVVWKNSQWWYFADYVYLIKIFRKCIINEKVWCIYWPTVIPILKLCTEEKFMLSMFLCHSIKWYIHLNNVWMWKMQWVYAVLNAFSSICMLHHCETTWVMTSILRQSKANTVKKFKVQTLSLNVLQSIKLNG